MFDVFIMDMGGHNENVKQILSKLPHAQTMRYMTSHLEMVKRAAAKSKTEFFWLIASCCDYTNFNFNYIPDHQQQKQIHCWASGDQKFGDTFLIKVSAWKEQESVELLEWYKDINWHSDGVKRLDWPSITYNSSNLINIIKELTFTSLYIELVPYFFKNKIEYYPNLWREQTRDVISFSKGNSYCLVPKDVKIYLKNQIYDYPNIKLLKILKEPMQDIMFISYDELESNKNLETLQNKFHNVKVVKDIKGMDKAKLFAANQSSTHWFYVVFAKTKIADTFNFDFCPDYFQIPKHYVFYAHNTANDLVYGYAGVILFNVDLVKEIQEFGIDYTMSSPHAIVPELSAIAHLGASPYQAWRSAFRETAKLAQYVEKSKCIETEFRLFTWLNYAKGPNADWLLKGAKDGFDFYQTNKQSHDTLMLTLNWDWLKKTFDSKYNLEQVTS